MSRFEAGTFGNLRLEVALKTLFGRRLLKLEEKKIALMFLLAVDIFWLKFLLLFLVVNVFQSGYFLSDIFSNMKRLPGLIAMHIQVTAPIRSR